MSPTISNDNLASKSTISSSDIVEKSILYKTFHIDSFNCLNKTSMPNSSKLNDFAIYKSINWKIEHLNNKIKELSDKLILKKCQEVTKSLDLLKHSSESQRYLNSIKKYIIEDEDTESSSDDSYSQISTNHGISPENPKISNKYQSWLVERCQFQAKWSWLLSEIQSTEFRLKHLKRYSEEIKHLKRKYNSKNDTNLDENSRNKYSRLEKRKRVQIHNLLSADLIKFVSPLYSNDDNSSDKFVQCKCRLGDIGPCILCCGMNNKVSEENSDFFDKEDIWRASVLDNCIHTKLSKINDIRNQIKRNVLFNGYVKNCVSHWSHPRSRTSLSSILTAPSQPLVDYNNKVEPVHLKFQGIDLGNKEYKLESFVDYNKNESDTSVRQSDEVKVEIKLPLWRKLSDNVDFIITDKIIIDDLDEDLSDEVYIKRHEYEEILERKRNYPLTKILSNQTEVGEKNQLFHGYEYKPNSDSSYDLRLFPLLSTDIKQLSQSSRSHLQRSKNFKKRLNKF